MAEDPPGTIAGFITVVLPSRTKSKHDPSGATTARMRVPLGVG